MNNENYELHKKSISRLVAKIAKDGATVIQGSFSLKKIRATRANYEMRDKIERQQLYWKQSGRCFYCGKHTERRDWSIDHMIPIIRLGTNSGDNFAGACIPCNLEKDFLTAEEYMYLLKEYPGELKEIKLKIIVVMELYCLSWSLQKVVDGIVDISLLNWFYQKVVGKLKECVRLGIYAPPELKVIIDKATVFKDTKYKIHEFKTMLNL